MKIGKKTAVTKEINRKERNRRNNIKRITISLLVAFIVFICLTVIQSSILNQEEKQTVYQVIKDISVGTKITEDNISEYLGNKEVQISLIPDGYITDSSEIIGKFINRDYKANDIITVDGITDTEKLYRDNIEKPVEVSFSVDSLSTAVSGTIREGDYINIYGLRRAETSTIYGTSAGLYEVDQYFTFKHVYIARAFNGDGSLVETPEIKDAVDGTAITTTMFTVILNEKDVDLFNEMLKNCDIRLAKLIYDTDTDYQDFLTETNKEAAQSYVTSQSEAETTQGFWETTPLFVDDNTEDDTTSEDSEDTAVIDEAQQSVENTDTTQTESTPVENTETTQTTGEEVVQY